MSGEIQIDNLNDNIWAVFYAAEMTFLGSYRSFTQNVYVVGTCNEYPSSFLSTVLTSKQFFLHSNNIISLDIYFQDMSYDVIEQTPVFESWTLIGKLC